MANQNTISPEKLVSLLGNAEGNVSVLDASWYLPAQNRDAKREFETDRIPTARFFDIDLISDTSSPLPHMMPDPDQFARQMGELGVSDTDHIIVYDGLGIFSCARAWWMLKVMGAKNVQVLQGGFDRWKSAGLPVESGPSLPPARKVFKASYDSHKVRNLAQLLDNVSTGSELVLDARSAERFAGSAPEPRQGLKSGHIPGSRSLPFTELLEDGSLKSPEKLSAIFDKLGVIEDSRVITSCGSGVTAAVISLALDSIGHRNHSLYDGSWSEWGQASNVPVETGT